jgi:hypothetical protein
MIIRMRFISMELQTIDEFSHKIREQEQNACAWRHCLLTLCVLRPASVAPSMGVHRYPSVDKG